ncbi:MAG TPA: MBL fold metallo-hydrolase [Gemmatimonadaceae bacterium]|nr:MBL fold metallo-hydrolase [Gemmatimonadaceae bacterium]
MRSVGAFLLLTLCVATACAQPDAPATTRVVVLGTGNPNSDPDRSGPSVAVVVGDHAYIVDAGPGVVRRAGGAYRAGVGALASERLRIAFITHLHSDHTLGLPDLIFSPWTLGRDVPLTVHGPPGITEMVGHLRAAYAADIRNRIDGLEPANTTGHEVVVHEVVPGVVYRDERVTVTAVPVEHGDWAQSFAYRFETADRTIVISGDARPSESIVGACNGCDVLLHEVYSAERFKSIPPEWQRYHARAHTSTAQLAEIATRARPKLLVLYHQLYWGADDEDLLREVQSAYGGAVVSARDLGVY